MSKMEKVYLPNGQECQLVEKISDNRYLIIKLFDVEDEDGNPYTIEDSVETIVSEIFWKKPVEKISVEIEALHKKKKEFLTSVNHLRKNKRDLESEISVLEKTHVSNQKFIINRTELINAKTLVMFPKDGVNPITRKSEDKSFRGLKLSLQIEISSGEERSWGCGLYHDYDSGSISLCPKSGILIDPTDEQVETEILRRVNTMVLQDYVLKNVDDKYLTPELIVRKNTILGAEKQKRKADLEKTIADAQKRLEEL